MKQILTENEIKKVGKLAWEMQKEANEDMTLEENMQVSLAGRTENLDEKEEVANLCKGIRDFDEVLGQLEAEGGKEAILQELERSELGSKSKEEQYQILAEALEAFQADLEGKEYDLGEMKGLEIKKDGEITEEDLGALKDMAAEYLDKFSLLHGEADLMESFFQSIGAQASEGLLQAYGDEDKKYYVALAIYILHLQGELSYMPLGMGARAIGANVSASFASAKAHIDGVMGKLSEEGVLAKLKKIASAALTVLVGAAAVITVFKVGKLVFWISSMVFGFGVTGLLVALVMAAYAQVKAIGALMSVWEELKEKAAEFKEYVSERSSGLGEKASNAKECLADKYVAVRQWILEKAIPALKEFWEKVKEKVSCLLSPNAHAEESEDADDDTDAFEGIEDDIVDVDEVLADA